MTEAQHAMTTPGAARRGALAGLYLGALVLGYALGAKALVPVRLFPTPASTPLARVGVALADERLELSSAGWDALRADVDAVRAGWAPEGRAAFELVAAVRGLARGGAPAWAEAEGRCRALRWPRCDRPALEALRKRSRP